MVCVRLTYSAPNDAAPSRLAEGPTTPHPLHGGRSNVSAPAGYVTGEMVIDCIGGWTAVSLDSPLAKRHVIDSSIGEVVEVLPP